MHKITLKALKKHKKKSKKGKKKGKKDEELFRPEELEAYRLQQQQKDDESSLDGDQQSQTTTTATNKSEDWRKFLDLTSGIDDVLKRTQGDLDRIKSTSYFQRVVKKPPPPSRPPPPPPPPPPKKSESESENGGNEADDDDDDLDDDSADEDDDDIFDTEYIEALASGQVKLAYIPDSPPAEGTSDDPFDTSYADRAILGPITERKGRKLVPLGSAVEVLTGRVQLPSCVDKLTVVETCSVSLLDEDNDAPFLTKTTPTPSSGGRDDKDDVNDDDDDEFAQLATESLTKHSVTSIQIETNQQLESEGVGDWAVFEKASEKVEEQPHPAEQEEEVDPFDTSFASNLCPGKAELKQIENELLNNDLDFDPRLEDRIIQVGHSVTVQISGISISERKYSITDDQIPNLKPPDLLELAESDLTNLNDHPTPLQPSAKVEYCDPFDTSSILESGADDLKSIEREFLQDLLADDDEDFDPRAKQEDQAKEEESVKIVIVPKQLRSTSRPDILNLTPSVGSLKTVSFEGLPPLNTTGLSSKPVKPLTPYYVRKNSLPGDEILPSSNNSDDDDDDDDPFDTSFVSGEVTDLLPPPVVDLFAVEHVDDVKVLTPSTGPIEEQQQETDPFDTSSAEVKIRPGRTELKLLENELLQQDNSEEEQQQQQHHLLDQSEERIIVVTPLDPTSELPRNEPLDIKQIGHLLDEPETEISTAAPLNPTQESVIDEEDDFDPFDTSFADRNLAPGRTELKLLETELL